MDKDLITDIDSHEELKWTIIFKYNKKSYIEQISPDEKAFQEKILKKLNLKRKKINFFVYGKRICSNLSPACSGLSNNSVVTMIDQSEINEISCVSGLSRSNSFDGKEEEDEEEIFESKEDKIEIYFTTTIGTSRNLFFNPSTSISRAIKLYLKIMGKSHLFGNQNNIKFFYCPPERKKDLRDLSKKSRCALVNLDFYDKRSVVDVFKNYRPVKIIVSDVNNLIGA